MCARLLLSLIAIEVLFGIFDLMLFDTFIYDKAIAKPSLGHNHYKLEYIATNLNRNEF